MDHQIAFIIICAVAVVVAATVIGGTVEKLAHRRKPEPDHVESYWGEQQ